jgi:hypothetical protein
MNKYTVVLDKGCDALITSRKKDECALCNSIVPWKKDAYIVEAPIIGSIQVGDVMGLGDKHRPIFVCSEACANMYIMAHMDDTPYKDVEMDEIMHHLAEQIRDGIDKKIISDLYNMVKKK